MNYIPIMAAAGPVTHLYFSLQFPLYSNAQPTSAKRKFPLKKHKSVLIAYLHSNLPRICAGLKKARTAVRIKNAQWRAGSQAQAFLFIWWTLASWIVLSVFHRVLLKGARGPSHHARVFHWFVAIHLLRKVASNPSSLRAGGQIRPPLLALLTLERSTIRFSTPHHMLFFMAPFGVV